MTKKASARRLLIAASSAVLTIAAPAWAQVSTSDKWITVVLPAEPPDLEGCSSVSTAQGIVVKQNIVETLIEKNPTDGSLKPRLAESWEQVDPNTWRIKLREGVTFHDGTPFDAAAVRKSLDRTKTKALACGDRSKFFGDIGIEVTPTDAHTLIIKTSRPDRILPMRLTGMVIVGPASSLEKRSLNPIGTGPYVIDSWQPGQQIRLKRYDRYWGPKPEADGARYVWRPDSSVRAAMVKLGEADIALTLSAQDANDPKMDYSYLNSQTSFLRIDMTVPPLDDKRVRLALNYAFDREAVRQKIFTKDYINATQMVFPAIPGHNNELDKLVRSYDPAKAKQLLAEARADGVPVDTEIQLLGRPSGYPEATEVMETVMAMYQGIGLNVKLRELEPGEYSKWSAKPYPENRPANLLQNMHDNSFGDPVFSVPYRYACTDGNNSTYCDPAFDAEVTRVSGLSGTERIEGWQEIFRHLYEDVVPEVWMYHMVGYARVGPRVGYVPDVSTNNELRIQEIHFK